MTAIVVGMVRDRARAEDIVQDVFVSALRRMRQTDSELHFRGWISEIARNASIDHFRRANRSFEVSMDAEAGLPAPDVRRLGTAPAPEQAARGRERLVHLRGALDELTDTHQRVIVLREFEGHSYHDIGRLMDLTPSGVESTLFRARRRLEHEYEALDTGERCRLVQRTIGAMTEGSASRREVGKVRRHVARCSACALHARMEGVDTAGRLARVAALLPIPPLFERRGSELLDSVRNLFASGSTAPQALAPATSGSAWEQAAPTVGKALAVAAAAFTIGHGPASTSLSEDRGGDGSATASKPAVRAAAPSPSAGAPARAHRATGASRSGAARGPSASTPPKPAGADADSETKGQAAAPDPASAPVTGAPAPRPAAPAPSRATPAAPAASGAGNPKAAASGASGVRGTVEQTLDSVQSVGSAAPSTPAAPSGSVVDRVQRVVPSEVTVPGASQPLVKPRETVQQVDSALRGVLGQ